MDRVDLDQVPRTHFTTSDESFGNDIVNTPPVSPGECKSRSIEFTLKGQVPLCMGALLAINFGKSKDGDDVFEGTDVSKIRVPIGPGNLTALGKNYRVVGSVSKADYHLGKDVTKVTVTIDGEGNVYNYWRGMTLGRENIGCSFGVLDDGKHYGAVFWVGEPISEQTVPGTSSSSAMDITPKSVVSLYVPTPPKASSRLLPVIVSQFAS